MVKSGSFKVSQGSLASRIGSGVGQGLAETLPKEMDRGRLSQGLQQLSNESANLTPLQQYAKVASIPGITPQMIQALPEILKQQNLRQAYANRSGGTAEEVGQQPMEQGGISAGGRAPTSTAQQQIMQQEKMVAPTERGQPQIVETNPLREEAIPAKPWTPRRFDQEVSRIFDEGLAQTVPEAMEIARSRESRELAQPAAVRAQDEYLRGQQDLADQSFQKHLETKLEKKGEGLFKDITGENLTNLKRSMYKDLRTDPNATIEDVANYWSNKALDLAKTKSQLTELANKNIFSKITKGSETAEKLKSYQKIFAETGNQEEFYNNIRTDFNLSPQGAAYLAYPRSKEVSRYIEKAKAIPHMNLQIAPIQSRKYASDIENLINRDDSLLAISRELRQKEPMFDQRAFFSQLREDQDSLGLTPRQKREIAQGESEIFPNWGDVLLLPNFRGL